MDAGRRVLPGASLYAEGQRIVAIGTELPYQTADVVIDGRDKVVYPGLISTHHHLYQTFTRNIPRAQDVTLFDWLITLYEIWRGLRPEDIYLSALVGLGELLKTGCTTATDHFYCFPDGVSGELIDEEVRAAGELGMRFHPTRGSMSRGKSRGGLPPDEVCQDEEIILRDTRRVIEKFHDPSPFAMVRVGVAPCSPFSVTTDLMRQAAELARSYGVMLHTHLAETLDEEDYCMQVYGKRPLEYMEECGWLGGDVWYAHGIHFNDEEIGRIGRTRSGVCHCPMSNMKLASGLCQVPKLLRAGARVGLGVDGSASNDSSNMLLEVRVGYLLHKFAHGPQSFDAGDLLALATRGSAQVINRPELGSLEVGKAADLFLIDVNQIGFAGALHDDMSLPVVTGSTQVVDTTVVGGRVVVQGGRLTGIDEEQVARRARAASLRLLEIAARRTGVNYAERRLPGWAIG